MEVLNYRVPKGRTLIVRGKPHHTGEVLPEWYANWDGGLESRVRDKHLEPTLDPATGGAQPPEPTRVDDPAPKMATELNRLMAENNTLRDLVKEHDGARLEFARASASKDRLLGEQTVEIDRLREGLFAAQKRCEELTLEVEQVTIRATVAEAELAKVRATRPSTSGRKTADVKPPETPIVSGAAAGFVMTPAGVTSPAPPG